uniref:Ciliogenesis-associated TTC17-interacting protein n=2 Tax=Dromaius novaehollandiae TaxID=8790 RepID=A0A8C4KRS1_DRONO
MEEPPCVCPPAVLACMEGAARFLSLIGPEELERCLFVERLVAAGAGAAGGEFWVTVQRAAYGPTGQPGHSCLLVRAGSHSVVDGVPCATSLQAYVSLQLETLEQELHECVELRAHPIERRLHVVTRGEELLVSKTLCEGQMEMLCERSRHSLATLRGLLAEGAGLLLLRVLARRGTMPPRLAFPTLDAEGHLCTVSYRALGIQQQPVGPEEAEVLVMERAVRPSAGIPAAWHLSCLRDGRLARWVQVGCPVVLLLQRMPVLTETDEDEPQPVFPKQPLAWEADAQLYSCFLDRKEELQASHAAFVRRHPELGALLADFLQALLLRQPPDPVAFAAAFFAPFAHRWPPGTRFAAAAAAPSPARGPRGMPPS